ncbi:MAG: chemotaxis protein CheW, partial [Allosphingosinicella sp.]
IESVGGARIATIRGRRVPLVSLGAVLGSSDPDGPDQKLILLKPAGSDVYALAVDQVHDHEELVVKPAAPAVMAAGLYAGTTLADDGRPVLLLDPPGIAARAGIALERRDSERVEAAPVASDAGIPALMFLTMAGARSVLPLSAIERIEDVPADSIQVSGGRLHVAIDGRILPLEGCNGAAPEAGLRILRLTDGAVQIAYGFDRVIDIVSLGSEVRPVTTSGEVRGVTLIGGDQVEVIDLHWLFATHSGVRPETDLPICVLSGGDPWMDTILRPIVESAGYCVVRAGEQGADRAEIIILAEDETPPSVGEDATIVRLRSDIARSGGKDGSIHRYDRAALIGALGNRKRGKA